MKGDSRVDRAVGSDLRLRGRILAVDYGTKRVGLAVTDETQTLAQPLATLKNNGVRGLISAIVKVVEEEEVISVVVGLPYTMRGEKGPMAERVEAFAEGLSSGLNVPVSTCDESLSSASAERALLKMGRSPSREKERVDQLAAVYILRSHLASLRRLEGDGPMNGRDGSD